MPENGAQECPLPSPHRDRRLLQGWVPARHRLCNKQQPLCDSCCKPSRLSFLSDNVVSQRNWRSETESQNTRNMHRSTGPQLLIANEDGKFDANMNLTDLQIRETPRKSPIQLAEWTRKLQPRLQKIPA